MTAAQISANRAAAVAHVRAQLGLASRAPSSWTYDERTRYNKALADYIAARPGDFAAQDLVTAGAVQAATYLPLEDNGLLADLSTFGAEFASQAVSLNESVNPFSERNRGALLMVAVVGVALYFAAPALLAGVVASKAKGRK